MTAVDQDDNYNRVFESFVLDENDQVGLVAYALYKRDKREFLITWRTKYGVPPTPDQVAAFVASVLTEGQRQRYRAGGQANLDAYAGKALEKERPLIAQAAITERIEAAVRQIERASRWYRQVPAGIASALVYTVVLIAVLLVLRYAEVDLVSILEQIN
jgi:hypothetical protein